MSANSTAHGHSWTTALPTSGRAFLYARNPILDSLEINSGLSMSHGGARPGAGRPRKLEKYAGPIAAAEAKIQDALPMIVDRMIELVDGITVQETDSHGQEKIYSRPPDREAGKYLMDRIMGKPTQPVSGDSSMDPIRVSVDFDRADQDSAA